MSLSITPTSVYVTHGSPLGAVFQVAGATGPVRLELVDGTLPAGLQLSGNGLAGIARAVGATTVTVRATDSSSPPQAADQQVTITVT